MHWPQQHQHRLINGRIVKRGTILCVTSASFHTGNYLITGVIWYLPPLVCLRCIEAGVNCFIFGLVNFCQSAHGPLLLPGCPFLEFIDRRHQLR